MLSPVRPSACPLDGWISQEENRAAARKPRDACYSCSFPFQLANKIHYKYKTSQASIARLQSSKQTGAKQNLTQNEDLKSFKVKSLESAERNYDGFPSVGATNKGGWGNRFLYA